MSPDGEIRLGSRAWCGVGEEGSESAPELWLARPAHPPIRFAFRDPPRADAREVVMQLRRRGIQIELLSGDRAPAVRALAEAVGIETWTAGCTPADKATRLAALAAAGRRVLMVGDGLNDAPALAAAFVSMSPASAADISQTAADLVFQGDRLQPVLEALDIAHAADRLVRQNLAATFVYNLLTIPLAVLGYVTPLIAAAAMSGSSLVVILNALRLSRARAA
jgi:Cu2+-exporting ATPase